MSYVSSLSTDVMAYEPITISGEVSFSGLGNGTDFQEIIDATVSAESFQLEDYEAQKAETEYIVDLLDQLNEELDALNETFMGMDEVEEFYEMTTVDADEVDITVTGEADTGAHTIVINQLAQSDVWVNTGQGFSSESEVVADTATTLELTYGGESISIDVSAGTTLEGLVNTVNASVDARGKIEADLMYDGSEYYFVLRGEDEGADNAITIADTGTLNDFDPTGFENTLVAQNSQIKVDGFPTGADEWIERDTNSIDDVIDGVTFDLQDVTDADGVTISVGYDVDAMAEKIGTFVAEVNQILLDIQTLTGRVESDDDDEDTYTIDSYALDIVYNDLKNALSSGALGFKKYDSEDGGDTYNALSQIGFSTDTEEGSDTFGQLLLDEDELGEALENDPEAVGALFAISGVGESDSDSLQVISVIDTVTPPGEHEVEYVVSGGVLVSATVNGEEANIDADNWTILGIGSGSSGLYISVEDQTDGTHDGLVRVKQGKIGELSDILTNVTDDDIGTLPLLIESYESSITNLDNNIYNEEKRLDTLEQSLTRKYAALDGVLSLLENRSALLESQLAQL